MYQFKAPVMTSTPTRAPPATTFDKRPLLLLLPSFMYGLAATSALKNDVPYSSMEHPPSNGTPICNRHITRGASKSALKTRGVRVEIGTNPVRAPFPLRHGHGAAGCILFTMLRAVRVAVAVPVAPTEAAEGVDDEVDDAIKLATALRVRAVSLVEALTVE